MPIRTPETIRRALGEEAAADLGHWVEQIVAERAVPRDEYRQVLARLEVVEHDVADVKVEIFCSPTPYDPFEPDRWWSKPRNALFVVMEYQKFVANALTLAFGLQTG